VAQKNRKCRLLRQSNKFQPVEILDSARSGLPLVVLASSGRRFFTPLQSFRNGCTDRRSESSNSSPIVRQKQLQIVPSASTSRRLSTEGLPLRKNWESVNAFRCFFAEGEIGGTLRMRSHISVHLATTKYSSISFICKNKIEKEGLPKDSPAGLGAGGPECTTHRR
jgi:hypothetical protein